jgi:hypothetical protein
MLCVKMPSKKSWLATSLPAVVPLVLLVATLLIHFEN